jgi:plastocyanin
LKKFGLFFFAVVLLLSPLKISATIHTVLVMDTQFSPPTINVTVGDTVKWQWVSGYHTTTCDPGIDPVTSLPPGAATWNAPMDPGNPVFNYVVTVAGTYQYVCLPHSPSMAGTINATEGSSVFLIENFDYPAGDSLGAHGWISFSGGSTNVLSVVSPGLTYTGYSLSGIGNAAQLVNTGQDAYTSLSSNITAGEVYTSFMVRVDTARTGDYFLGYLPSTNTTNYTGRVYAKDTLGMLSFGLSRTTAAAGGIFYTLPIYQYNTTYLLVLKYEFKTGSTTDDEVSLYVFTEPLVPPTEPAIPNIGPLTGTATDLPNVGRVALRQGTTALAPNLKVDGIKTASDWNEIVTGINHDPVTGVPNDFILYQNYPNPFNPSTTISFAIPQGGFVDLRVYDILGKEVAMLVDNDLNPGSYNVSFNAGNLNSGVYFYRMNVRTNDGNFFTDSKKLLLIK